MAPAAGPGDVVRRGRVADGVQRPGEPARADRAAGDELVVPAVAGEVVDGREVDRADVVGLPGVVAAAVVIVLAVEVDSIRLAGVHRESHQSGAGHDRHVHDAGIRRPGVRVDEARRRVVLARAAGVDVDEMPQGGVRVAVDVAEAGEPAVDVVDRVVFLGELRSVVEVAAVPEDGLVGAGEGGEQGAGPGGPGVAGPALGLAEEPRVGRTVPEMRIVVVIVRRAGLPADHLPQHQLGVALLLQPARAGAAFRDVAEIHDAEDAHVVEIVVGMDGAVFRLVGRRAGVVVEGVLFRP